MPVERMDRLRLGGHAVDVRGAALEVVDRMGRILFRSGWIGIDPADRRAQCHLLRRRFSGMDWETPRLLDALDGAYDYYFDEMAQVRMPRWSFGRIGLPGDAAFGPSPLSGQGTSVALIGGYLLAHHLDSAPDVLTAFARWRMPGLARTRAGSSPWVKAKGDGPRLIGRIDVVGDQAPGSHSRRR